MAIPKTPSLGRGTCRASGIEFKIRKVIPNSFLGYATTGELRRESWSVLTALFQLGSISNKELFQQRHNRMTTNIRLCIQRLERRAKLTGSGHKAIEFRIDISST